MKYHDCRFPHSMGRDRRSSWHHWCLRYRDAISELEISVMTENENLQDDEFDDEEDIILDELDDEELVEQMHDDLYNGLKEEIEEGTNIFRQIIHMLNFSSGCRRPQLVVIAHLDTTRYGCRVWPKQAK